MNGCSFAKTVSERDWLRNSAKIWELVKKSPVISEYSKALQKSGLFRRWRSLFTLDVCIIDSTSFLRTQFSLSKNCNAYWNKATSIYSLSDDCWGKKKKNLMCEDCRTEHVNLILIFTVVVRGIVMKSKDFNEIWTVQVPQGTTMSYYSSIICSTVKNYIE